MISQLIQISNYYGTNPDFVLAGGGNTSCKDKDYLYIKASGESLGTIKEDGFVKMSCEKLKEMTTKQYPADDDTREAAVLADLLDARADATTKRPSVETLLHYLMPQTFVIHTHPAIVNGVLCIENSKEIIKSLFGDKTIWLKSMMPGYMLSKTIEIEVAAYKSKYNTYPQMIFLENHGVFVAADTIEEIKAIYNNITDKIKAKIKSMPDTSVGEYDKNAVEEITGILTQSGVNSVEFITTTEIQNFTKNKVAFAPVASVYTPDHMVYCGADGIFAGNARQLQEILNEIMAQSKPVPRIIAVQNLGVFACGNSQKSASTTALLFNDTVKIAVYTKNFGQYQFLSDDMIHFIGNWEAEKYRSGVSLK